MKMELRFSLRIMIIMAVLFFSACASPADTKEDKILKNSQTQKYVEGEYIVTLQKGSNESAIRTAFSGYSIINISLVRKNSYLVKFDKDPGLDELQKKARDSKDIVGIQPNYVYKAL